MKFFASLSTLSDDEHYSSQDDDLSPRSLGPEGKGRGQQFGESAYDPNEDELDSLEEKNVPRVLAPQKRKLEEGASLQESNSSPPSKKPNPGPLNTSNANKPAANPAKPQPSTVNNISSQQLQASASPYTDRGPVSLGIHPPRRKAPSTIIDDRHDRNYVADNSNSDEDKELEELENTYAIPDDEKANVLFDFDRERHKRLAVAVSIPKNLYTQQEKSLFLQLAMRGFEPLAPKHWQFDFPTLPDSLFPEPGKKSDPIIKISRSTTFYAIKSLMNLFSLSGRVRDCNIVAKRPEALIKQTINRYIRWALYDVNLEIGPGSLPIHVLHAQRKHETILNALERLNKRLKRLALQHQRALSKATRFAASNGKDKNELPLLIGFIICGPIVAIMAFDLSLLESDPDIDGKFISQFDLSERGQDVWNSLSLTIIIMHIRNTMVRLTENSYGEFVKSSGSAAANEDL